MKRAFFLTVGSLCILLGIVGAILLALSRGDMRGRIVGVIGALLVAAFGLWLTRRVEKRFWKVIETILEMLFISWS